MRRSAHWAAGAAVGLLMIGGAPAMAAPIGDDASHLVPYIPPELAPATAPAAIDDASYLVPYIPPAEDAPVIPTLQPGATFAARITHYCACARCNGARYVGLDARGQPLRVGVVACNALPIGERLLIGGMIYTVRDRMARTTREGRVCVDVYIDGTHEEARALGVRRETVEVVSR